MLHYFVSLLFCLVLSGKVYKENGGQSIEDFRALFPYTFTGEVTLQPGYFSENTFDDGFYIQNEKGGIYCSVPSGSDLVDGVNQGNIVTVTGSTTSVPFLGYLQIEVSTLTIHARKQHICSQYCHII